MIADQPKLRPLLEALERLCGRGLTVAVVVAAFHHRGVLPLMARRRRLFEMTPDEALASSPTFLGGGGEDASGPAIARPSLRPTRPRHGR